MATSQNPTVSPRAVDMGQVNLKSKNQITVTLLNPSDKPLIIRDIQTDCNCTKPTWSKAPIAPGDSTQFTITFTPTDRGAFYKTVRLTTVPESSKPINVTLRGKVK